ncbi:MAG: PKD domain-containing protein, partial [Candidatus Thermoplasmatota archaeon]|nr:PKD domain-containing protein [Candidatus Thermoplasmatota archaeon]
VASFIWVPSTPKANQTITFDASTSSDLDGSITKYEWDWDNNGVYEKSQTTPTAINSWAQAGSYSVKLQVTDNGGLISTKTMTVSVSSVGGNGDTNRSGDTNGNSNTSGNGNTNNKGTPGFELVIVFGAIVVAMFLFRKKRIV